jgi:hemolysin activation/secretion protein
VLLYYDAESGSALKAFNINIHLRTALFLIALLSGYAAESAAAPAIPDVGDIPRPQPVIPPAPVKPATIGTPDRPASASEPASNTQPLNITVSAFRFSGNRVYTSEQLASLLTPYLQRELSLKELNQAARLVTDYYRKHGYFLAQAYIPAQDIADNSVEISVLEGQLGKLTLSNTEALRTEFIDSMASYQLADGDTLSEQTIVRNITLLNALPGLQASAELNPGATIGSSDVNVSIQALPTWSAFLGANTYGNRFTGREVLLAGLTANNLADIGDQLTINLKNARDERQRGLALNYVTPIHASGTLLTMGYHYVDYRLGGPFKRLGAEGDAHYLTLNLDQPIVRNAQYGLSARVGGAYKWVDDDVSALSLSNRRHVVTMDAGLLGDWYNQTGDVSNQVAAFLRAGHVDFKDAFAQTLDATGADTAGHFLKLNLMGSRTYYLNSGVIIALRADYQLANTNLDSVEKIAIGGINRWRAFAELPSLADTGYMAGVELRKNIAVTSNVATKLLEQVSPYGFIDIGRGKVNQSALSDDNHVKSTHYGVGIDALLKQNWLLGFTVSHQRRAFEGAQGEDETRAWGQLQKAF